MHVQAGSVDPCTPYIFPGRSVIYMAKPLPGIGQGEEYELRSPDSPVYDLRHDSKVIGWRFDCFRRLGFTALHADAMALRRDVDRVLVERMVRQGAKPELVSAIVL